MCITLFCTFLSHRYTTLTWKCLISRFVEDANTRQQLSFSFPELWYSPFEFNTKKFEVWGSPNSRFHNHCRHCCLRSLTAYEHGGSVAGVRQKNDFPLRKSFIFMQTFFCLLLQHGCNAQTLYTDTIVFNEEYLNLKLTTNSKWINIT